MGFLKRNRFLLLRRVCQIAILALFMAGNFYGMRLLDGKLDPSKQLETSLGADRFGLHILQGSLSSAKIADEVPLTDPLGFLQLLLAGGAFAAEFCVGAAIVVLFYAIVGGRVFCAFVCPINMVTDLAAWLRRKLGIDLTAQSVQFSRSVRYYALGLTLLVSLIAGVAAFDAISPIGLFMRAFIYGAWVGLLGVLAIFLWDLFAHKNGYCGHICPLGAFYAIVGKFAPLKIRFVKSRCTDCLECKKICPEKQVLNAIGGETDGAVTSAECLKCGRCVEVCESGALSFGLGATQQTKENK